MKNKKKTILEKQTRFVELSPKDLEKRKFHIILAQLGSLHDKKSSDYGVDDDPLMNIRASVELGIEPWKGALLRLNDKVARLRKYAKQGKLANESAIDSLNDIAVYAIITRLLLEETY